jgi:hypothetical protein
LTSRAIGEAGLPLDKVYRQPSAPKPLRAVNLERRAKLEARNFGPHGTYIRLQPCVVQVHAHPNLRTECQGRIMAAHLVPRGMGGCNGDRFSLFPACAFHHGEQEGHTAEFQATYQLDLAVLVEVYNLADLSLTDEERDAARERLRVLRKPR